jgi:L-lactate dehydrogenase complex protein LldG
MTTGRDAFLERVRQAVQAGNRPGSPPLDARGAAGYQGAGPDPVARFCAESIAKVLELVRTSAARNALVGEGPFIDSLALPDQLQSLGIEVTPVETLPAATSREAFFAAAIGISEVDYLIAETGTVVLKTRPGEPRSLSLLPPVHIAVAERRQLLADLFDLFESLPATQGQHSPLPSCLSLITGPSKTGDIELRLVTGVHGPGEIHVVLVSC